MSMSKKEKGFDLPEDIVVKILCRLPVKSLFRFTCVSKRWRSFVISDPQFCKSHLQLASQLRQRLLITTYPMISSDYEFCLPPRFLSLEDEFIPLVKHSTSPPLEHKQQGLTSCNGLVLVGDKCFRDLENWCIWNPSTGFFRKIPSPRVAKYVGGKRYLDFLICGFGYVSATEDYKLVLVTIPRVWTHFHVYIFSLRANCWRVIEAPLFSSTACNNNFEVGTLSNGAIHWVNYLDGVSDPTIYAFDLAEEEFREMPLPVSIQNVDCSVRDTTTQVLLGGCLCVRTVSDDRRLEVWAMTEYAVPESWVKLFGFTEHDLPDVFPSLKHSWGLCFVTEGGTVVIRFYDHNELVRIECCKEEKPVCSGRYLLEEVPGRRRIYFNATVYEETLVSVPE